MGAGSHQCSLVVKTFQCCQCVRRFVVIMLYELVFMLYFTKRKLCQKILSTDKTAQSSLKGWLVEIPWRDNFTFVEVSQSSSVVSCFFYFVKERVNILTYKIQSVECNRDRLNDRQYGVLFGVSHRYSNLITHTQSTLIQWRKNYLSHSCL